MKTLVSALILSATFMGSAYAGELDYPPAPDTQSSLTRVQVQQELAAAAPTASWCPVKKVIPPPPTPAGDKTRAQVQQELAAARAQGLTESGELDYPPVQG